MAFDALGQKDSARTYYERYANAHIPGDRLADADALPRAYLRLGELYEERSDWKAAMKWYDAFVTLWKDADPELQPKVSEVRARLDRLRRMGS
jgi:tetratricopeptide (TPR) repeat protein